jgi:hypothetical protein
VALGLVRHTVGLASMRAAYAALILGFLSGLVLATGVLSGRGHTEASTVAGVLALHRTGADLDRRHAEAVAALVARCMAGRGLPWTPWVEPPPTVPDAELDPTAWAVRWGLGVSTTVGRPEPEPASDPNLASIAATSPADRERYREALDGRGGCRTAATDSVYGIRDRALAPLQESLRDLEARIAASPAAVQAKETWRRCVEPVAAGHTLDPRTLQSNLREWFVQRLMALGHIGGLVALQVDERRVATVLAECDARYEQARVDAAEPFEAAFLGVHRTTLEAIGAAIRSAEAALPTVPR